MVDNCVPQRNCKLGINTNKVCSVWGLPGIDFWLYASKHFINKVEENIKSLPVKPRVDTKAKGMINNEEYRPLVHSALCLQ